MDVQGMEESDQLLSESDNEENSAKTGKQTPLDRAQPKGVIIYRQFAVWKLLCTAIANKIHPRKESGVVGAKVMDRGGVSEANQTSSSSGACLEITFTCQVYTCTSLIPFSVCLQVLTLMLSQSVFFVSNVFIGHISDDPINLDASGSL